MIKVTVLRSQKTATNNSNNNKACSRAQANVAYQRYVDKKEKVILIPVADCSKDGQLYYAVPGG